MKQMSGRISRVAAATFFGTAVLGAPSAEAVVFALSGTSNLSGDTLSASIEFQVSGTLLTVILTNTQATAASDGGDVLDGVYFDIASAPTLSNGNAFINGSSAFVLRDNVAAVGNSLNTEWMFDAPVPALGRMYGLGSTGWPDFNPNQDTLDELFHGGDVMAGANSDYGLVPVLGISAGNFTNIYVNNSVKFTFDLGHGITEDEISDVWVSYGSSGDTVLTPEPATFAALALGGLALARRRRK